MNNLASLKKELEEVRERLNKDIDRLIEKYCTPPEKVKPPEPKQGEEGKKSMREWSFYFNSTLKNDGVTQEMVDRFNAANDVIKGVTDAKEAFKSLKAFKMYFDDEPYIGNKRVITFRFMKRVLPMIGCELDDIRVRKIAKASDEELRSYFRWVGVQLKKLVKGEPKKEEAEPVTQVEPPSPPPVEEAPQPKVYTSELERILDNQLEVQKADKAKQFDGFDLFQGKKRGESREDTFRRLGEKKLGLRPFEIEEIINGSTYDEVMKLRDLPVPDCMVNLDESVEFLGESEEEKNNVILLVTSEPTSFSEALRLAADYQEKKEPEDTLVSLERIIENTKRVMGKDSKKYISPAEIDLLQEEIKKKLGTRSDEFMKNIYQIIGEKIIMIEDGLCGQNQFSLDELYQELDRYSDSIRSAEVGDFIEVEATISEPPPPKKKSKPRSKKKEVATVS